MFDISNIENSIVEYLSETLIITDKYDKIINVFGNTMKIFGFTKNDIFSYYKYEDFYDAIITSSKIVIDENQTKKIFYDKNSKKSSIIIQSIKNNSEQEIYIYYKNNSY